MSGSWGCRFLCDDALGQIILKKKGLRKKAFSIAIYYTYFSFVGIGALTGWTFLSGFFPV